MRSSFFEFNVAISALSTARANLEVVSHNIANAANVKYSKQYAEQRASQPLSLNNGKGMVGTGSEVYGVGQLRDSYLDQKYWTERCVLGEYSVKRNHLTLTESIFNELSDTGLTKSIDNFFQTIQDLTTSTNDATYRTNVIQAGQQLSSFINYTSESIRKQQTDLNGEVKTVVNIINSLGDRISSLNKTISQFEMSGNKANDLRDERAALVDELSLYVNVTVKETEFNEDYAAGLYPEPEDRGKSDKRFSILINGDEFVNHYNTRYLEAVPRDTANKKNPMDVDGLYDIKFTDTRTNFNIYSSSLKGQLKGLIDMRDGNNGNLLAGDAKATTSYKGVPHYMNKLNELVRVFARAVNQGVDREGKEIPGLIGHESGYDQKNNKGLNSFFTYYGLDENTKGGLIVDDYSKMNCLNFQMNPKLLSDPEFLAAYEEANSGESENKVILSFATLKNYGSLFKEGKVSDYINGIAGELGIDLKQATNFNDNYTDVTSLIENQRFSVSGVSLNEEMIDMVKYQQLYQAAAKLVNTIDQIYDTLINRLGA